MNRYIMTAAAPCHALLFQGLIFMFFMTIQLKARIFTEVVARFLLFKPKYRPDQKRQ